MPTQVEIPDQGIVEFPDDMTPDQIKGVIQNKFYSQPQASTQEVPSLPTQEIQPQIGLADMLFDPQTAQNLRGGIQDVVYSIPGMAAQIPKMAYQGLKFAVGGPQERAQIGEEALTEAIAQGQQMASDLQAPIGSRESFRGFGNVALMATPAIGEAVGELALAGRGKPPIQARPQIPEGPITDLSEQPIKPEEVIQNAPKEGIVTESNIQEYPRDAEGRPPAETSGGGGVEPSPEVAAPQEVGLSPVEAKLGNYEKRGGVWRDVTSEGGITSKYEGLRAGKSLHQQLETKLAKEGSEPIPQEVAEPVPSEQSTSEFQPGDKVFMYARKGTTMTEVPVELLPDTHVRPLVEGGEATPIEDYGDYILSHKKLSEKQAFDQILKHISERESTAPVPEATVPTTGEPLPKTAEGATTAAPEAKPETVPTTEEVAPPLEPIRPAEVKPLTQDSTPTEVGPNVKGFETVYGPGEIKPGQSVTPEEIFRQGQSDLASGKIDPYQIADRARTGDVSPKELGAIAAEHHRLITEAAAAEGTLAYEGKYQAAKDFAQNMLKPAGTKWHQTGIGLQVKAPIDLSNLTGFRAAFEERFNKEMSPEQAQTFSKMASDLSEAKAADRAELGRTAERVKQRFKGVKDIPFDDAVKSMHELIKTALKDCNL